MKNRSIERAIEKTRKRDALFGIDDLQELLLQISFAIMMVFMMAYFLFRAESRKEREEQLLEIERQKLVLAAEAVDAESCVRYGLDALFPSNRTATTSPHILNADSLTSDPVIAGAFLKAARNGAADLNSPLELRRQWISNVCKKAELEEAKLARESFDWLSAEADSAIAWYGEAVRYAEFQAASELQRHWLQSPSAIDDPRVTDILAKLDSAGEDGRLLLVTELSTALKRLAFERLAAMTGAEMLK